MTVNVEAYKLVQKIQKEDKKNFDEVANVINIIYTDTFDAFNISLDTRVQFLLNLIQCELERIPHVDKDIALKFYDFINSNKMNFSYDLYQILDDEFGIGNEE